MKQLRTSSQRFQPTTVIERRLPLMKAAPATGEVLRVILATALTVAGWEVILARRGAMIRKQAVQHSPDAVSL